jgi:DNA-binding GntR family transcriptional regulator
MGTRTGAPPAAERVYEHVKGRVLDQTYPPGELLTEGDVAAEVGVSRTPVREALLRLEAEGLLRLYPKRGALVVPVTANEAREVLEARGVIESWAARRVVTAGPQLVDELESVLDEMREHADAGDLRGFVAADRAFHEALVTAAGNSILSRLYVSLRDRQMCISVHSITVSPERLASALRDHEGLLEALRNRDAAALEARTAAHLANASPHDPDAS